MKFFALVTGLLLSLLLGLLLAFPVMAARYPLPAAGDSVIGSLQVITVSAQDMLIDIARRYDIGFDEIRAANPDIDPWLPADGSEVLLPTRYILPDAPREGVVINLAEKRLYYFPGDWYDPTGVVLTYPVSIGKVGLSMPVGEYSVSMTLKDPSWTVPDHLLEAYGIKPGQSRVVAPGEDNPLGQYAIQLSLPGYFIHGTNRPYSIGMRVSQGCIRMYPEDIEHLIHFLPKETKVLIVDQPVKIGYHRGGIYVEVHKPLAEMQPVDEEAIAARLVDLEPPKTTFMAVAAMAQDSGRHQQISEIIARQTGVPYRLVTADATGLTDTAKMGVAELGAIEVDVVETGATKSETVAAGGGQWVLQLGAYQNIANAQALFMRLSQIDDRAYLDEARGDGLVRVMIGPFARAELNDFRDLLQRSLAVNALVRLVH